jgi:uncharacterized protein YbjT (DUF2867 family)
LVQGDLDDRAAVDRALAGSYGAYSVQTFMDKGTAGEEAQGKAFADAAKAAGIQHFVYSSVGGAERHTGIPHFDSKWHIEEHIRHIGLPTTVLRPVFFMENFKNFFPPALENGVLTLRLAMQPARPLALIAVEDIGHFAALAFDDPQRHIGQALELAGDELTLPEVAAKMEQAWGRKVAFVELPIAAVRSYSEEMAAMFEWFNTDGYQPDIAGLRKLHPGLLNFSAWLKKSGWQPA